MASSRYQKLPFLSIEIDRILKTFMCSTESGGEAPRLTTVRRLRASFDGRELTLPTIAQFRPAESPPFSPARYSISAGCWIR